MIEVQRHCAPKSLETFYSKLDKFLKDRFGLKIDGGHITEHVGGLCEIKLKCYPYKKRCQKKIKKGRRKDV